MLSYKKILPPQVFEINPYLPPQKQIEIQNKTNGKQMKVLSKKCFYLFVCLF